jgi:signal transduction histidine kinase
MYLYHLVNPFMKEIIKTYSCFFLLILNAFQLAEANPLSKKEADSTLANQYFDLAWKYRSQYPDSSLFYANKTYQIAQQYDFLELKAYSLGRIADYYRHVEEYDKAYDYLLESLAVRQTIGDSSVIISGYNNLGNFFIHREQFDSAIFYFNRGMDFASQEKALDLQAKMLNGISMAYLNIGSFEAAALSLNKAIDIGIRQNDSLGMAKRYQNLALLYEKMQRNPLALKNLDLAANIYRLSNNEEGLIDILINKAAVLLHEEKYIEAIQELEEAEQKSYQKNFLKKRLTILNNLGFAYQAIHKIPKAKSIYRLGVELAERANRQQALIEIKLNQAYLLKEEKAHQELLTLLDQIEKLILESHFKQYQYHIYLLKADAFAGLGRYKEAFQSRITFSELLDSLNHQIDNAQILAAELEQEKDEQALLKERNLHQETELKKQKAENRAQTIGIWALTLLFIASTVIFLQRWRSDRIKAKAKEEKQKSEEELMELLNKIDLEILEKQVEAREKATYHIGQNLHDTLGSKLAVAQMSFDNLRDKMTGLDASLSEQLDRIGTLLEESCNDTRSISHELMEQDLQDKGLEYAITQQLERLQGIKGIRFHFIPIGIPTNISGVIQQEILHIIRTLIENILRHSEAKEAIIQIRRENHLLHISIEDDGKGFDVEYALNNGGKGLRNVKQRTEKLGGEFHVESSKEGTQLMLFIPFKFQNI